jgi:muramoyltetrapeptide carboxypeptidase
MPDIRGSILFLEDDDESTVRAFDRNLQSLLHQPGFEEVKGIVFGRFQPTMHMTREVLTRVMETKPELRGLPILANADFGHTHPTITFPIGGKGRISAEKNSGSIEIIEH